MAAQVWRRLDLDTLVAQRRHPLEYAVTMLLIMGVVAPALGTVAVVGPVERYAAGVVAFAVGLVALDLAVAIGHPLKSLRVVTRHVTGGRRYDQRRYWNRLKTSSLLLNLLLLMASGALAIAVAMRWGLIEATPVPYLPVLGSSTILGLAMVLSLATTLYLTLRVPMDRPGFSGLEALTFTLMVTGAAMLAGLAALVASRPTMVPGVAELEPTDAPFLLLAGCGLAAAALYASRSPPSLAMLFREEDTPYMGRRYLSRTKAVILPTLTAFGLLFVVVLATMVFSINVMGLSEDLPRNTFLLSVVGFLFATSVTTIVASLILSRVEDRVELYRVEPPKERRRERLIMGASALGSVGFFAAAAMGGLGDGLGPFGQGHWFGLLILGLLTAMGPYGLYVGRRQRHVRRLEERFPDFLRDVAASKEAGLVLTASVTTAAKGEYGDLTPEVEKMADQISWNVPFGEALRRFADRVGTPLVLRSVYLIQEAERTGGNVTDVLDAAARDARELKSLEKERRASMALYVAIIYVTFLVFLGCVAALQGVFVPQLVDATSAISASGQSGSSALPVQAVTLGQYRTFFIFAALVQAVGNGIIAGLIENGRALSGLRHSSIMVALTYVTFKLIGA